MRIALGLLGALLVLFGGVWFLQGINVLPGSFMTGQIRWAVIGAIAVIAGVILLVMAARKRRPMSSSRLLRFLGLLCSNLRPPRLRQPGYLGSNGSRHSFLTAAAI
jgi:uncharacterized membrane protein HdeD (DUF308 family)